MHRSALVAGLVTLVAAGMPVTAVAPAHATGVTTPSARPARVTSIHRYRLITGQSVQVMRRSDGTATATLPSGTTYRRIGGGRQVYVLPRLTASERRVMDVSLFDAPAVARAARRGHGRVPVVVRFRSGDRPTRIAGLRLDPASRRTKDGRTLVRGSYGRGFRGVTPAALRGVARIRLALPGLHRAVSRTTPTQTVQVSVTTKAGHPARYVDVAMLNVDDITTYAELGATDASGVATFTVPVGDYSAIASTFTKVVQNTEFSVSADTDVALDLGDATVRPTERVPGHREIVDAVGVSRFDARGFFPWTTSFAGVHLHVRLQPASGKVPHGWVFSGVGGTFVAGKGPTYGDIAVTEDVVRGVPDDFTEVHPRSDFAEVVDRFHANGPDRKMTLEVTPNDGRVDLLALSSDDPVVPVPGPQVVFMEAGPRKWFDSLLTIHGNDFLQDITRFRKGGSSHVIPWARGPVGPGMEGPFTTSSFDGAWRYHNLLALELPLFSGAGHTMDGILRNKDGEWSLRSGHHVYAHGHGEISTFGTRVPRKRHRYVLTAASHPRLPFWQLSTDVRDVWVFHSARPPGQTQSRVPILMASYVASQDARGNVRPGPTAYRLGFSASAPHPPRVVAARVQISTDDGHTWHSASVTRLSPTAFRVRYDNPAAHGTARFLSLRVTGRDAHGDHVTETALRAYRLG